MFKRTFGFGSIHRTVRGNISRARTARLIAASGVAFAIGIGAATAQDRAGGTRQEPSSALAATGEYIARAADCAACHTAPNGKPFAGGYPISSPLGTIYSTNITPSKSAGIGSYSEAQFARALREGVRGDGTHLYPAMPYTSYAGLSDADVGALYAYFMQDVAPVDVAPPKTALPFPFSVRGSMAIWNMLFLKDQRFQPDPTRSTQMNRGAYLVESLEHCGACHTPRNSLMAEKQGAALSGGSLGSWYAPNVTSDRIGGIGGWTDEELYQYLRTGHVAGKAQAAGPMAEAVQNSLQYLTDEDTKAMVAYLKHSPSVATPGVDRPRYAYGNASTTEVSLRGTNSADKGWEIFSGSCAACHQENGTGTENRAYPSLFHNSTTGSERPDNLIATILFGLSRTVDGKTTYMPGFGSQASFTERLSDEDISAVSNYVLAQYGNPSIKVTAADVATIRQGGPAPLLANLTPAVLIALVALVVVIVGIGLWMVMRRRHDAVSAGVRAG
ncbi:MAG: cytochrome c [Rhodopila sp.]|nr:cytochrome c [Rhodopila sp.]